jgi:branched-chain amino acid transport system substrate-binding protein
MGRLAALLAGALCVAALAGGCGGSDAATPIRIGVLVQCTPPLDGLREPLVGAVEAPLIRRGAEPAGRRPTDGLRGAEIAGRPVEFVEGCTELNAYSLLIEEARRLVETERVDVVIGGIGFPEGVVFRRVAERYPATTFVAALSGASGVTYTDPPPNLFRFGPSTAQAVAGLGTHAYRELGWRTAAIVADDYAGGWDGAAGFAAEFCALGGRIVSHDLASLFAPAPTAADVRRAQAADGVAVLSVVGFTASLNLDGYMTAYARGQDDLSRRVVLGGATFEIPENLDWAVDPTGIVVAAQFPMVPTAEGRDLARLLARTFPGLPTSPQVTFGAGWYEEAAEAVVGALERAGGDLSGGQRRFRAELSESRLSSARGPVRLDANRQGITTTYLGRVDRGEGPPSLEPFRDVPEVDRTLAGVLTAVPGQALPPCLRRRSPPWAR